MRNCSLSKKAGKVYQGLLSVLWAQRISLGRTSPGRISLVVLASMLISCESAPDMAITFCESLDQYDHCPDDRNQFTMGKPIFVRLSSDEPFVTKKIEGKIFRIQSNDEKMIPLGTKDFDIKAGDTYITQSIPFHEFGYEAVGNFKVMFFDEEEQMMAERELIITRE